MTTIVLAEDSFIVREGVGMLLDGAGYDFVASVETCDELMEAVDQHHPDVAVTDARMAPTETDEGARAAREIRASHPQQWFRGKRRFTGSAAEDPPGTRVFDHSSSLVSSG